MKKGKVAIIRCEDYNIDSVFYAIKKGIDLIGGIKNFVKENEKHEKQFNILEAFFEIDGIISLTKMKAHQLTRKTGAIKNQFVVLLILIKLYFILNIQILLIFAKCL